MNWVVESLRWDGSVLARVTASGPELRLGRALDNDLVLDDPHCAAHHAVLRIDADGKAQLHDLNTLNGIRVGTGRNRGQRHTVYAVQDDTKIQLGNSSIRVRHLDWALAAEKPLSTRLVWPFAVLALLAALGLAGWELWCQDVHESPPTYLANLSALAAGLTMWSTVYATLGRLLGGPDRFFTHLLIVCCAYMGATLLHNALDWVAFAYYWLWPLRISNYATVVVVALTVRAHLRIVDPRHWPVMRWGVAVVTIMAIAVPVGQTWISSKRLTHVQLMNVTEHPALRLAEPVDISSFMQTTLQLQTRANQQRALADQDDSEDQTQD